MIKETKVILYTNKIKNEKNIIMFSDIHYTGVKDNKKLDKIYKELKTYNFDYICIPGDIIENIKLNDNDSFLNFIKKLSLLSPVIISLGNHDLEEKNKQSKKYYCNKKYLDRISKLNNVYLLDNAGIVIDEIYFYGATLNNEYYKDESYKKINNIKNDIDTSKYNVLLIHSPICISKINDKINNYDLVLSGHMHNGMIPPLLDEIINNNYGIISPNKKLFPKYARGVVQNKNNITIISSAVTKLSRLVHILNVFNIFYPIGINYIKIKNGNNKYEISYNYK